MKDDDHTRALLDAEEYETYLKAYTESWLPLPKIYEHNGRDHWTYEQAYTHF